MTRLRWLGLLAAVLVSVLGGMWVTEAQESAPSVPGATTPDRSPPTVVRRAVMPDGTVEIEYADGTKRRVPGAAAQQAASEAPAEDQIAPIAPPAWLNDPATSKAFLDAMGEYYAYRASGLQHRRRVFEWQLASSKIIFVTVLVLVASGIVFAAIQFRAGMKRAGTDARDGVTEIDLSTTSVKVSSPVLGVIILVISLAFFYLYLVYVYPISEIV